VPVDLDGLAPTDYPLRDVLRHMLASCLDAWTVSRRGAQEFVIDTFSDGPTGKRGFRLAPLGICSIGSPTLAAGVRGLSRLG
jgi:hypothetical protein